MCVESRRRNGSREEGKREEGRKARTKEEVSPVFLMPRDITCSSLSPAECPRLAGSPNSSAVIHKSFDDAAS